MRDFSSLTGLARSPLATLTSRLRSAAVPRGRPWALPLERRVVIACTSLRTNLTVRELAAVFAITRAQAHRIVTDIIQRIAMLMTRASANVDRRYAWVVDGTLVPTRDHAVAKIVGPVTRSCSSVVPTCR